MSNWSANTRIENGEVQVKGATGWVGAWPPKGENDDVARLSPLHPTDQWRAIELAKVARVFTMSGTDLVKVGLLGDVVSSGRPYQACFCMLLLNDPAAVRGIYSVEDLACFLAARKHYRREEKERAAKERASRLADAIQHSALVMSFNPLSAEELANFATIDGGGLTCTAAPSTIVGPVADGGACGTTLRVDNRMTETLLQTRVDVLQMEKQAWEKERERLRADLRAARVEADEARLTARTNNVLADKWFGKFMEEKARQAAQAPTPGTVTLPRAEAKRIFELLSILSEETQSRGVLDGCKAVMALLQGGTSQ